MGPIAVLDTNVLIELEKRRYGGDKNSYRRLINGLVLKYSEFWIPNSVKSEFIQTRKHRRRFKNIIEDFQNSTICPITVGANEIYDMIIKYSKLDEGEADAIKQISKAKTRKEWSTKTLVFVSHDHVAVETAKSLGIKADYFESYLEMIKESDMY